MRILKLTERALHASTDPNEAKMAIRAVRKTCDEAGMTISDIVAAEYARNASLRYATDKQLLSKIAALEAERGRIEAERDIAIMTAEVATGALRATAELEAKNATLEADKVALVEQIEGLTMAIARNATATAEATARIAELEARLAEALAWTTAKSVEAPISSAQDAVELAPKTIDPAVEIDAVAPVHSAPERFTLAERFVAMARNWRSSGKSLWTIATRLTKECGTKVTKAMVHDATRWTPNAEGYCWEAAS